MIHEEFKKLVMARKQKKIDELMIDTYPYRQCWIKNSKPTIAIITKQWPPLSEYDGVSCLRLALSEGGHSPNCKLSFNIYKKYTMTFRFSFVFFKLSGSKGTKLAKKENVTNMATLLHKS